jgi:hypothetical protein
MVGVSAAPTVFVCGAVLLGLKIVGSRVSALLRQFHLRVGQSISIGGPDHRYYMGGFPADRRPRLLRPLILIAAGGDPSARCRSIAPSRAWISGRD